MGAGFVGTRHIEHILARPIVDPTPVARGLAVSLHVDWFASFRDMLSKNRPDGAR
jgi:hypothetical protein